MNTVATKNQITLGDDYILIWIESFLKERKAQNLTRGTIKFYRTNLKPFTDFLDFQGVKFINQINPSLIRDFLLLLEERGHNPGGIHGFFRAIKAFLKWYWEEMEPDYSNPIDKVKAPRVPQVSIEGISRENFDTLISVCENTFLGSRDKAILLTLLDTGVRATELCNIRMEDVNFADSSIFILQGKGRKPRLVFFGKSTRKQLRKYLKFRGNEGSYLFINRSGEKLIYTSLRQIIRRLCIKAEIEEISLHSFRRAFCLECLMDKTNQVRTIEIPKGSVNRRFDCTRSNCYVYKKGNTRDYHS